MAGASRTVEHLGDLVRARVTAIGIESHDEERITRIIGELAVERKKALVVYSITWGFRQQHPLPGAGEPFIPALGEGHEQEDAIFMPPIALMSIPSRKEVDWEWDETKNGGKGGLRSASRGKSSEDVIYLIKDMHHFLADAKTLRAIRDLCRALVASRKTLIFLSPSLNAPHSSKLPADIEKELELIRFPYPNKEELEWLVRDAMKGVEVPVNLSDSEVDELASALQGLTETEAEKTLRLAMIIKRELSISALPIVLQEKDQIVAKAGRLEPVTSVPLDQIGSLECIRDFMDEQERNSSPEAVEFLGGLAEDMPKGFLAVGHPGTGKSLVAKAAGGRSRKVWRLDISKIYESLVGSSERNLVEALRLAEAMGVTLWIDEIEKLFGQGLGQEQNGGISDRLLGIFLTWMQEQTSCFVVATANSIRGLPGALLRRFDVIFFVDLPTQRGREDILAVHLRKRKRNPESFDIKLIAQHMKGYSGAEIERVVRFGLSNAWKAKRELDTDLLQEAVTKVVPMSKTQKELIEQLRQDMLARDTRPASYSEEEEAAPVASGAKASGKFQIDLS